MYQPPEGDRSVHTGWFHRRRWCLRVYIFLNKMHQQPPVILYKFINMATSTPFQQLWYKYSGIIGSSYVLYTNLVLYTWASHEAMIRTSLFIMLINCIDILYIGNIHMMYKEYSTIVHHLVVSSGASLFYKTIQTQYPVGLYHFSYWMLLVEISSWFNQFRLIVDSKRYPLARQVADYTFGAVFLTTRSVASTMTLYTFFVDGAASIPYFWYATFSWYILTVLNYHWGSQICRKAMGYPRDQLIDHTIPYWRWGLFYALFGIPLVFL